MPHTPLFPFWIGRLKLEIAGWKLYRLDALSSLLCLSLLLWNNYCYVDKPRAGPMTSAISRVLFSWYSFQETFASDLELQQRSPAVLLCFSWSTWHMRDTEIDSFSNDLQETLTVVCVFWWNLNCSSQSCTLFPLTLFSFMYVKEGEEGENMPWCLWCNCYLELWYMESCQYGWNWRTGGYQHPALGLFACVFLITWCNRTFYNNSVVTKVVAALKLAQLFETCCWNITQTPGNRVQVTGSFTVGREWPLTFKTASQN